MTHKIRGVDVEKYAHYVNILRQNVGLKHDYDVKLWRHKQRTPNTNDHQMPLNKTPHENFLRTVLFYVSCETPEQITEYLYFKLRSLFLHGSIYSR